MDDIDRELQRQLDQRAEQYRVIDDDQLEELEVDDQLVELPSTDRSWLQNTKLAASRLGRSVSVELEREGAIAESSGSAAQRQEQFAHQLRSRRSASREPTGNSNGKHKAPQDPHGQEEEEGGKTCRMCLGEDDETDDDGSSLGPLIAPCSCKGSMKWVHAKCLYKWRATSASPASTNTCGQCSFRYRLKPPRGGAPLVWALNSQPLRVLFAIGAVAIATLLSGFVTVHTLKGLAHVPRVNTMIRSTLRTPPAPYRITLGSDKAVIQIQHALVNPTDSSMSRATPHADALARASIEALTLVQETKRGDPIYYDLDLLRKWEKADNAKVAHSNKGMLHGAAENVLREVTEGLSRPFVAVQTAFRNVWAKPKAAKVKKAEEEEEREVQPMSNDLSRMIEQAIFTPDPSSEDPEIRSGRAVRGLREVTIEHSSATYLDPWPDPSDSLLVRYIPEKLGFFRYLPFGLYFAIYVYFRYHLEGLIFIFRRIFIGVSTSAAAALLVLTTRRGVIEIVWLLSKVAVSGIIAYLGEGMQAAKVIPKIIDGAPVPHRSKQRIWAARVRSFFIHGSMAVFGPYWHYWWGGYSVGMYLRPAASSYSLFESIVFGMHGTGSTAPVIVDGLASLIEPYSAAVHWFRERYSKGWIEADWTMRDFSASEGYRRLLAGLLGDERKTLPSRFDKYIADKGSRLLAGRVRPAEMAGLVRTAQQSWSAYLQLIITVGMLVVVSAAAGWALHATFQNMLKVFFVQVIANLRHIYQLFAEQEWIVAMCRRLALLRRPTRTRRRRGIRARYDPMLDEGTPVPADRPATEQVDPAARPVHDFGAAAAANAHFEFQMGDAAIGVALGAGPPPRTLDAHPSLFSLAFADLMSIYGSVQVITQVVRIVCEATVFTPFIFFYTLVRDVEKQSRVQRDVVDLSRD